MTQTDPPRRDPPGFTAPTGSPSGLEKANSRRAALKPSLTRFVSAVILVLGTVLLSFMPWVARLDAELLDRRMKASPVAASGEVVLAAIDAQSIAAIGAWPWSRQVHADLLNALSDAGARDVFFDIDFAFGAEPAGDRAFAAALEGSASAVYLAAFAQAQSATSPDAVHYNLPYLPFRDRSWLASVNIRASDGGVIRAYPMGGPIAGEFTPSAGAVLAGRYNVGAPEFGVNYAIQPASVRAVSIIDIITGAAPAEALDGRTVVVGATAVELGDLFAVPVHGVIPGSMIHVLAAETLLADRPVRPVPKLPIVILFAVLLAVLHRGLRDRLWRLVAALALIAFGTEAAALAAFRTADLAVPTASLYPVASLFGLIQLALSLDLTRDLLRRNTAKLQMSERLLEHVFENGSDGFVVLDEMGHQVFGSAAAFRMFGAASGGAVALPGPVKTAAENALSAGAGPAGDAVQVQTVKAPGTGAEMVIEYTVSVSHYQDAGGTHRIAAISARDVTEIRQKDARIHYLSDHDALTGALRRHAFLLRLEGALGSGATIGLFALNLRRFKVLNLTLGRHVGDAVLAEVVRRLERLEPCPLAIVRFDGDGFGFFVEAPGGKAALAELAAQVQTALTKPFLVANSSAQIGVRLGYAVFGPGAETLPDAALTCAEEALDASGTLGETILYEPAISKAKQRARDIESCLATALQQGEFELHYQPQVRLSDRALVGVEALLRWTSPRLGPVSPGEFIEIAEASGFIDPLGAWVIDQGVRDATRLPRQVEMAVNISGVQLQTCDVMGTVKSALAAHGLNPARLCLEITETVLVGGQSTVLEIMGDIAWLGPKWALDDFGTGYSSLAYLSSMPLSKVKLDQAFVRGLGTDPAALAILRSVREICDRLDLDLLCEGAETAAEVALLAREGCNLVQGYYFGRPQPMDAILTIAEAGKVRMARQSRGRGG